jgi:hypothetical protein
MIVASAHALVLTVSHDSPVANPSLWRLSAAVLHQILATPSRE